MGRIRFPKMLREFTYAWSNQPKRNPCEPAYGVVNFLFVSFFGTVVLLLILRGACAQESYWLDELHSLWSINSGLPELLERSQQGNQSPLYSLFLWNWESVCSALPLGALTISTSRMLSISLSIIPLVAYYRFTRNGSAAPVGFACICASLLFALDTNAIFFGSEVRCYVLVIALSSLLLSVVWQIHAGDQERGHWRLGVLCLLLGLCHYTAIIACAWLIVTSALWSIKQRWSQRTYPLEPLTHWRPGHTAWGVFGVGLALVLQGAGMLQLWERRHLWSGIGKPRSLYEWDNVYPWISQCMVPLVLWGLIYCTRKCFHSVSLSTNQRAEKRQNASVLWLGMSSISFLLFAWLLSRWGTVPIWQTRYLVAVLPWLYWLSGLLWSKLVAISGPSPSLRGWLPVGVLCIALLGLVFEQGTWRTLFDGSMQWVSRGEDWRGAVNWIDEHASSSATMHVAPELLETEGMETDEAIKMYGESYLCFPVRGPYPLPQAKPIADFDTWIQSEASSLSLPSGEHWILIRKPAWALADQLASLFPRVQLREPAQITAFDNVSVIKIQIR